MVTLGFLYRLFCAVDKNIPRVSEIQKARLAYT